LPATFSPFVEKTDIYWQAMRLVWFSIAVVAPALCADPLNCGLTEYKAAAGLTATLTDNALSVAWDADKQQEMRLRLGLQTGTPTIRELAIRRKVGDWATLATNVTPEFRIVSGMRRMRASNWNRCMDSA
jgi:hypothetical protein